MNAPLSAHSNEAETNSFIDNLHNNQTDASDGFIDKDTDIDPIVTTTNTPADSTSVNDVSVALSLSPNNSQPNPISSIAKEIESAIAPRAKINISLKKKSKPSSSNQKSTSTASTLLADEYTTIAEEAEIISRRRQEEGTVLIIPCNQSKHELDGQHNKQPLLAGRLASLRMQQSEGGTMHGAVRDAGNAVDITNESAEDTGTGRNRLIDALDDESVMNQLIQSAEQSNTDKEYSNTPTISRRRGLVISAPTQNNLTFARRHNDVVKVEDDVMKQDEMIMMNDDELFKRELSHHAADVDPTSNVYANVAIHDFGSALLRGMGWTGGPESSKGDETQAIKPRPHRLGLGATPLLPLPSSSGERGSSGRTSNGTVGSIHRRARRPDEVKRDEDRRRQQEESEKREAEKKRLDVQHTLQKGSIVYVINQDGDADNSQDRISGSRKRRALVIRTAGVPGLNRILIQIEGSSVETSVTRHSVSLCSWEELEMTPYESSLIQNIPPDTMKSDRHLQKMLNDDGGVRSYDTIARDDARNSTQSSYTEEKRRKRNDHDRRSRSRSGSRERTNKRRKETSSLRQHRDDERYVHSRSRSPVKEEYSSPHHRKHPKDARSSSKNQQQEQLNWLIPNIRVRLISNKIPKYYLQKGVVQDVLLSPSRGHGGGAPKAIILLDNGQVLDKVPERYLETALPKAGGKVIVLEGRIRWKVGILLERSKDGQGTIQLEEDLDVVRVSLDSIAEWRG